MYGTFTFIGSLGIGGEVGINHGKSQRATFFDILIVLVA